MREKVQSQVAVQPTKSGRMAQAQTCLRYLLPLLFVIALFIPGYTYFVVNQSSSILFNPTIDLDVKFYILFRLFGLYAMVLMWGQIILGPFMAPLNRLYGRNWLYVHRTQGLFALLLAFLHPPILYLAYYLQTGVFNPLDASQSYVGPQNMPYVFVGITALTLLTLTVSSAILMRHRLVRRWWRRIHLLNYVVFGLVMIHALQLGSDVTTMPMYVLYWIMAGTYLAAIAYRRVYRLISRPSVQASSESVL